MRKGLLLAMLAVVVLPVLATTLALDARLQTVLLSRTRSRERSL
jgi:hypothetical protein